MMNLGYGENPTFHGIRPVERKIWRVVKPLTPEEQLKNIAQTEILENDRGFTVFRMKRKAEIEPSDVFVIDNVEIASVRKKLQTHSINQLEKTMETLTIEKIPEERKEEQAQRNTFLESLMFNQGENGAPSGDMTYVLKRIDTSNIFELGEEEFRKYYRTVYNETRAKEKREDKISGKRKNLMDNFLKEKEENAKNQLQLYDVNFRQRGEKGKLLCNGVPMKQTNFLEIATKKNENAIEEEEAAYDIFYLGKAKRGELMNAPTLSLDAPLQSTLQREVDENDLTDDDPSEDEALVGYNDEGYDSNDEDHPRNNYPDEEAEGLDDYGGYNDDDDHFGNDDDDEESDLGDYDPDDSNDGRYDFEKDEKELARRENFWSVIKDYQDNGLQWPGKKRDYIEEEN